MAAAVLGAAGLAVSCDGDDPPGEPNEEACQLKPSVTFHRKIEPLLQPDQVTTCNKCHLSGVDLSAFARETPCKTWACLVEQDLVNVDAPEDSLVLSWILRASPDSELITDDVTRAEHDALLEWIQANAACPASCAGVECGSAADAPACDPGTTVDVPEAVTGPDDRGCSDTELEQAFMDDVYASRGRCFPCHFDTETRADPKAPRWLSALGNCATGSAVTFKRVVGLGLIDADDPESSLLLLKPLDDAGGGVEHGGDQKFADREDPTYLNFLRFIQHYSECVNGK